MVSTTGLLDAPVRVSQPTSPILLPNHRTQSAVPLNGWKAALFGIPFMAVGVGIAIQGLNAVHSRRHSPEWLIGLLAGMFFLAGFFFFLHGVLDITRKSAYRREAAQRPSEPWLYDFHWRREGVTFSAFGDMLKRLMAAVVWTAFLLPFGWVGLNVRGGWPFLIGVTIFGLCGLFFWYRWATMLLDLLRYGNSFLGYGSFPYFLGGPLHAELRAPRNVAAIDDLTLTLRCVEERYITTGNGRNRSTSVVCYELYKDVLTFDRARLQGLAAGVIPFDFRLPSDQPVTTLVSTPPSYWEIEAKGKARGVDYEAVFLVPVYKPC
jgi:hypothetical protein